MASVGGSQDSIDGADDLVPAVRLFDELRTSVRRQPVVARAPVVLGGSPERRDPAAVLEAMERRIQRAVLDAEHFVRLVFDRVRDRVTVGRPQDEGFEHQHVERALEKLSPHRVIAALWHLLHKIIDRSRLVYTTLPLCLSDATTSRRSWG